MDNLDKIKFKESTPRWLFKIDESSIIEFKIGTRFVDELQAWKDLGNEIETRYTTKEQDQNNDDDILAAKQQIIAEAKAWLAENDFKYMQNIRRKARGTITSEQETEFQAFLDDADEKAQLVPPNS